VAALALLAALVGVAVAASTNFSELASSPEPVGLGPIAVAAADLDGDGDRDLATANVSSGDVTVLRNNGAGDFAERATSPEDAGSFPSGLAAADLDGDGDQDLAVTNQVSEDVTILRNKGSGNFVEPATSPEPTGAPAFAPVAADLDGDGDRDLAVASGDPDNHVTILRNKGSGNFVEPATSPEPVGNGPFAIAVADLDGDGDRDLAVANQQSANVTILRNRGTGNFVEPATSPEGARAFPHAITAAQFDGKPLPDLVVANEGDDNVTVLDNLGAGDFAEPATSPELAGDHPFATDAADFDADGDRDVAVANTETDDVTILRNGGTGNLGQPATSPEDAGDHPGAIVAADLDGDLDPDLAIANQFSSNVTILRNR
jgi:hypothetical protein